MNKLNELEIYRDTLNSWGKNNSAKAFFAQEVNRFICIARTILNNPALLDKNNMNARYITHILSRSLIENFFKIIYIFDSPVQVEERYDSLIKQFQNEYRKLWNEKYLPYKDRLEPSKEEWKNNKKGLNIQAMLAQVKNNYGNKLDYLYFIYRITSFDTHGNSLTAILSKAFDKEEVTFPKLELEEAFNLIADEYTCILLNYQKTSEFSFDYSSTFYISKSPARLVVQRG